MQAKDQYKNYNIDIITNYTPAEIDALQIDCVIHLAGIAHDLSNQYVEADYYKVNFEGTAQVYDCFLASKASQFIYFSSIKAAVDHSDYPANEQITPNPVTPYGKSKLKAEQYIQAQHLPSGRGYYIVRPCMIHGVNNKGNLNLLYRFLRTGIPYPLGAFENKRSFLNADNLAFIINELVHQNVPSGIYHLADDNTLSTNEVVRVIAEGLNRKAHILRIPAFAVRFLFIVIGKVSILSKLTENMEVSNQKIKEAIGKPLPVSSEEGLLKTIQSFQ